MELHLHEWGDPAAPPVVCVHGLNAHGRRFRKLAEERLATRFRVLAPDLRGHGSSDWEPPWTIATHAHDVLETLDAAGIRRAPFVGHSFGGRLLLELAVLDPHRRADATEVPRGGGRRASRAAGRRALTLSVLPERGRLHVQRAVHAASAS